MPTIDDSVISLATRASGAVGDRVASHNQHGPYFRNRTIPTDPATARQLAARLHFVSLADTWTIGFPAFQVLTWDNYAARVALPDRFGRYRLRTAWNHFVRNNFVRLQAGRPMHFAAPSTFTLGPEAPLSNVIAHRTSTTLTGNFDDTATWATERGSFIALYASLSRPPTINFHRGPFQFIGKIPDGPLELPVSPFRIDLAQQPEVGNFSFIRAFLVRDDGRVSPDHVYRARTLLF